MFFLDVYASFYRAFLTLLAAFHDSKSARQAGVFYLLIKYLVGQWPHMQQQLTVAVPALLTLCLLFQGFS